MFVNLQIMEAIKIYIVVYIVPPVSCAHLEISQQHIRVDIYLAQ